MKKEIFIVNAVHFYDGEIDEQIVGVMNNMEDAVHTLSLEYNITRQSMKDTYGADNLTFDDVVDEYENWHKITSPDCKEYYQIEIIGKEIKFEISIV